MRKLITNKEENSVLTRRDIYQHYLNKYFNAFMSRYECTKGLDNEQFEYMLKQFWSAGSIACFKLAGTEGSKDHPQGLLVLCPYAPNRYNIYDYPTECTLINTRGVKFIPTRVMKINKDVVIGFIQKSHKSVYYMVDFYIKKITDVEMTIRTNLKALKTPWIIGVTPENEAKMTKLMESLDSDNPKLFTDVDDINSIKALVSGANNNLAGLYDLLVAYINDLNEFLGINNLGVVEKKEHLVTAEINANNEAVETNKESFASILDEFTDRIKEVLGVDVEIRVKEAPSTQVESPEEKDLEEESY